MPLCQHRYRLLQTLMTDPGINGCRFDSYRAHHVLRKGPIQLIESALLRRYALMDCSCCQSAGGDSIPHTLPGSSKVRPRIQNFAYFSGLIQFTTRAKTPCLPGRPPNRIAVPISSGRPKRAAHPWGFTRRVSPSSENGFAGSRLERMIGILRFILVPRRRFDKNHGSGSLNVVLRQSLATARGVIGMLDSNVVLFGWSKVRDRSTFRRSFTPRAVSPKREKGPLLRSSLIGYEFR